jgi:hypothetical protein
MNFKQKLITKYETVTNMKLLQSCHHIQVTATVPQTMKSHKSKKNLHYLLKIAFKIKEWQQGIIPGHITIFICGKHVGLDNMSSW